MTYEENISLVSRYVGMVNRCHKPTHKSYSFYGAIGVTVCDEWRNDIRKFIDWSLENGYSMELELDKDIRGDGKLYSPETCSWVTKETNANNKKNSVKYLFKGEMLTLPQISRKVGMQCATLECRVVDRGWSLERAVNPNNLIAFGEVHVLAKLKDEDVINMRKRNHAGEGYKTIWKSSYSDRVTLSTAKCAMIGTTWKHLNEAYPPKTGRGYKKPTLKKESPAYLNKRYQEYLRAKNITTEG